MHEAEQYLRNTENPSSLYVRIGGKRRRLFINRSCNQIGIIAPHKRRSGYFFSDWDSIEKIYYPKCRKIKSLEEINRQLISKYQRMARKATFSSFYLHTVMNADPTKSLYENGLTTGTRIDGEAISLKAVEKWCGHSDMQMFREAVRECKRYYSTRFNFRGYDGSLWVEPHEKDGKKYISAGFNKEFRNCGNGYYYLLINDEYFIGYDID